MSALPAVELDENASKGDSASDPSVVASILAANKRKPKLDDMVVAIEELESRERQRLVRMGVTSESSYLRVVDASAGADLLKRLVPYRRELAELLKRCEARGRR